MRLLSSNSERLLRLLWLALLIANVSLYLRRQFVDGPFGADFTIFLTGSHLLMDGRAPELYSISAQTAVQQSLAGGITFAGGLLPFNYPPYVAAFFVPVALFPGNVAFYIWLAVQWVMLVAWAVWVARSFQAWGAGLPSILLLAIFSFAPISEALLMGQMSLVSVVLWWWAFVSWRAGRDGQLGLAVALAAFKPQMALLLVVALLAEKKWRALAYAALTQALLWTAAVLLGGVGIFTSYLDILRLSASTVGTLGFYPEGMPNLRGLLTILGVSSEVSLWLALAAWLASLVAIFLMWQRRLFAFAARFGLTVLLAVLLSPHLYLHDASLLILAVVCIRLTASDKPGKVMLQLYVPFLLLFASVCVLVLRIIPSYIPLIVSMWLFAALLLYLLLLPIHRPSDAYRDAAKI